MKKQALFFSLLIFSILTAATFHTLPMDGSNSFASDEDFNTSTEGTTAYCTWDAEYLYLGYFGPTLGTKDEHGIQNHRIMWYVDTDPQLDPKTGAGHDQAATVWTQIMPQQPFWFDEQSWELPFNADLYIRSEYDRYDSVFTTYGRWLESEQIWTKTELDTAWGNFDSLAQYYEASIPLDSLGNPSNIYILGYLYSNEWMSDLRWDPDPQRDVGGTFGSWPAQSLEGGDGDKHADGKFNHWFSFELISGVSPDQANDPPVVTDVPDEEINEGESFSTIDLKDYVYDDLTPDTSIVWTYSGNLDLIVTIDENNVATISTPNSEWNGSETITFTAHDEGDKTDSDAVIFTVIEINDAPIAVNDTTTVPEDSNVIISVLTNDSDIEGDELTISSFDQGDHGSVSNNGDTTLTYTPEANFFGADSFLYRIDDGRGGVDSAMVYVDVKNINDPPEIVNLPDKLTLETNDSTKLYMMNYADDADTPDSLLVWTFESGDPAISYAYNEETDTLTVYSHETKGNFNLYATLTDDSSASDNDTIIVYVEDPSGLDFDLNSTPKVFTVSQNFPNPFNPVTQIRYGLPKASSVNIEIYSITGKKVYSLHEAFKPAGYNILNINAAHWSTGIYFYRIRAGKNEIVKKMMVIK